MTEELELSIPRGQKVVHEPDVKNKGKTQATIKNSIQQICRYIFDKPLLGLLLIHLIISSLNYFRQL